METLKKLLAEAQETATKEQAAYEKHKARGREVQQELLKRGVAVRYTGGLLRVTCGAPEENSAFLTKFAEILEETK